MIHEPPRTLKPAFLALVRNEDDGARRLLLREPLGDFQHHHAAGAVVVGPVVDGIAARWADAARVGDHGVDPALLVRVRAARWIVRALAAGDRVDGAQGVVVNRRSGDAGVIVMRAHQDIFAGAGRVGTGQNGDHVARRYRSGPPRIVPLGGDRRTRVADLQFA